MPKITVQQFADKAGVSYVIIKKRMDRGEIVAEVEIRGGKPIWVIDTQKYSPKNHKARKPGRRELLAKK